MAKAEKVWDEKLALSEGNFMMHTRVYKIPLPSKEFPSGYKVNCALWNAFTEEKLLILDNHEPFGYHYHPEPETNKDLRTPLNFTKPLDAIRWFKNKVEEVINEDRS